jgi:DNA-binding transcriptional regulator GbsR (MarR family)
MRNIDSPVEHKLRDIENRLVDIITGLGHLKGRSLKNAKITAHILIRREANQKLLRELTGYSIGTVSTILQSLEKMGTLKKHKDPVSKEYHYELDSGFAHAGSRSMSNIFDYFSQLEEFLKKIKIRLSQPHLSKKQGFENLNQFVNNMNRTFPAIKNTIQKIQLPTVITKEEKETRDR